MSTGREFGVVEGQERTWVVLVRLDGDREGLGWAGGVQGCLKGLGVSVRF